MARISETDFVPSGGLGQCELTRAAALPPTETPAVSDAITPGPVVAAPGAEGRHQMPPVLDDEPSAVPPAHGPEVAVEVPAAAVANPVSTAAGTRPAPPIVRYHANRYEQGGLTTVTLSAKVVVTDHEIAELPFRGPSAEMIALLRAMEAIRAEVEGLVMVAAAEWRRRPMNYAEFEREYGYAGLFDGCRRVTPQEHAAVFPESVRGDRPTMVVVDEAAPRFWEGRRRDER